SLQRTTGNADRQRPRIRDLLLRGGFFARSERGLGCRRSLHAERHGQFWKPEHHPIRDADADPDSHPDAHGVENSDTVQHADRDRDGVDHPQPHSDEHRDRHVDTASTVEHSDRAGHEHRHPDVHAHEHSDPECRSDGHGDADGHFHAVGYTHADEHRYRASAHVYGYTD